MSKTYRQLHKDFHEELDTVMWNPPLTEREKVLIRAVDALYIALMESEEYNDGKDI